MDYDNLDAPNGQNDNMGGTTQRLYYASLDTFQSIKKPTSSPTTFAQRVAITTAHTFKTGYCFLQGYCTMNKGQVDFEDQGEIDGKSLKGVFKWFYPGNSDEAHGFYDQAKNDSFIFLVEKPDSESKGYIQVGTERFPAKLSGKFTTGTNSEGVQGYFFEVTCMETKVFKYNSTVSLTPAP